jgi:hypothetical protein
VTPADEPCAPDYGGPRAVSENETAAIASFLVKLTERHPVQALMTLHSYAEMMLARWSYNASVTPPERKKAVSNGWTPVD